MMKPMNNAEHTHSKTDVSLDPDQKKPKKKEVLDVEAARRWLPHISKKQTAAIAAMLAAGLIVSVAAQHYASASRLELPDDALATSSEATLSELSPANGLNFSGLRSSLADLSDDEDATEFQPAPDKLNLAYFYRDGADTSDTIHSYAGEVYQKLMTADNEYLANIYDEAGVSPLNLAKRLGVSTSNVMGKYNPNASGQDPNDPSTWYIPNFKNFNVSFYNADGEQVNEYSNVKDIMAMASVYCYAHDYLDVDTFEKYCEELYEKSRKYTISIGKVYYDSGCINRTAQEEADDAKKVEEALNALKESLQTATDRSEGLLTQNALSQGSETISPENKAVLNLTGESSAAETKNYETQTDADGNAGGKGIVFHDAEDSASSTAADETEHTETAAPETAAASTEAEKVETQAPTKSTETKAQTSNDNVLVLGAMQRFQKLSSLKSSHTASTMEKSAQETLSSLNGVHYGTPGSYGSARDYAVSRKQVKSGERTATLTSDMLVFGDSDAENAAGAAPETAAASTEASETKSAVSASGAVKTSEAQSTAETDANGEKVKRYSGYEAGKGIDEVNKASSAASVESSSAAGTAAASTTGTENTEQQLVLGTFTGAQLKNMDETTLRQLIQESLAAEEQSTNTETDVNSKNYCPGHVDLYVKVTIYGFEDEKGLRTIDLKADDQDENESSKSLDSALEGKGWNGWTEEQMGYVQKLISQDWFKTYGLSISTINPKQPLTEEEISKYLSDLPDNISEKRKAVIRYALSSVGKIPYYWGGKASSAGYDGNGFGRVIEADYKGRVLRGLDCSGWIQWVYWSAIGDKLGGASGTATLIGEGKKIKRSELQPGDIIIRVGADSHVVMFLQWAGNGNMIAIHENASANNVSVSEVTANYPYYRKLID